MTEQNAGLAIPEQAADLKKVMPKAEITIKSALGTEVSGEKWGVESLSEDDPARESLKNIEGAWLAQQQIADGVIGALEKTRIKKPLWNKTTGEYTLIKDGTPVSGTQTLNDVLRVLDSITNNPDLPEDIVSQATEQAKEIQRYIDEQTSKGPEPKTAQAENPEGHEPSEEEVDEFIIQGNLLKLMGKDPDSISPEDREIIDEVLSVSDPNELSKKQLKKRQEKLKGVLTKAEDVDLDDQFIATKKLYKLIYGTDIPQETTFDQVKDDLMGFFGIKDEDPESFKEKLKGKGPLLAKLLMALFLASATVAPAAEHMLKEQTQ